MRDSSRITFEIKIIFISTMAILLTTVTLYYANNFYFKSKTLQDAYSNLDSIRNAKVSAIEQYINRIVQSVDELGRNESFVREIQFIEKDFFNNDLNMRIMVDEDYIPVEQIKEDLQKTENLFFLDSYTKKPL